jgi:TfoX/Sxy family transcriptional regulator of competence genes
MSQPNLDELQNQLSQAVEALHLDHELVFKPMFGGVCAYVMGRVFASLSNIGLALKLPPKAQEELLKIEGAKRLQYEETAPPSKSYIVVPEPMTRNAPDLMAWVHQSVEFVQTLPAPKPKYKSQP